MADSGFIRKVLFAVRLADPVTGETVSVGVRPAPHDGMGQNIDARPIINASGIFVWTEGRGVVWPARIKVDSTTARWAAFWQDVPPPVAVPKPQQRLITLTLRPSAAYLPDAGVTALRGRLYDQSGPAGVAIPGALVRLVAGAAGTLPAIAPPAEMIPAPGAAVTGDDGGFLVFARPAAPSFASTTDDRVQLRLLVTRTPTAGAPMTRGTPQGFEFLPGQPGAPVPDGRPLPRDYTLSWSDLMTA
jgi:hypothetical protein